MSNQGLVKANTTSPRQSRTKALLSSKQRDEGSSYLVRRNNESSDSEEDYASALVPTNPRPAPLGVKPGSSDEAENSTSHLQVKQKHRHIIESGLRKLHPVKAALHVLSNEKNSFIIVCLAFIAYFVHKMRFPTAKHLVEAYHDLTETPDKNRTHATKPTMDVPGGTSYGKGSYDDSDTGDDCEDSENSRDSKDSSGIADDTECSKDSSGIGDTEYSQDSSGIGDDTEDRKNSSGIGATEDTLGTGGNQDCKDSPGFRDDNDSMLSESAPCIFCGSIDFPEYMYYCKSSFDGVVFVTDRMTLVHKCTSTSSLPCILSVYLHMKELYQFLCDLAYGSKEASCYASSIPTRDKTEVLQEQVERTSQKLKCQLCMVHNFTRVYVPCGDVLCHPCVQTIGDRDKCVLCGGDVESTHQIYRI